MMKTINTLVSDIYKTIEGRGGWDGFNGALLGKAVSLLSNQRFSSPQKPRGYLSLSSVGTPCKRKLWYKVNKLTEGDATFVHYVLRMYAAQTPGLDSDDKAEIKEVANKFA